MDFTKELRGEVTRLSDTRVAVEITLLNEISLGILYFEKPKMEWVNKPILPTKWRCIDAKVEGVYQYKGNSVTPTELMKWAQELVEATLKEEHKDNDNNKKGKNSIPNLKQEFKNLPPITEEHDDNT